MQAIKSTLLALNELIKTDKYWDLPVDITVEIAEAKKQLVIELEREIKSLRCMSADKIGRAHV